MQNEYKIHEGQSLFDVAVHNYGATEAAFELAASLNQSLTEPLHAGTAIQLPKNTPSQWTNRYVIAAINNRNLIPRTAPNLFSELAGIGHMEIWVSFRVA